MGSRESVPDVARNLSRWVDGIVARVYAHATVEGLARHATIPVINGLSDFEHPCQAVADFFTLWERGVDLERHAPGLDRRRQQRLPFPHAAGRAPRLPDDRRLPRGTRARSPRRAAGARAGRPSRHHPRSHGGRARRRRPLHRRVDQHGAGGRARGAPGDLQPLPAQRAAGGGGQALGPGHALPARASRARRSPTACSTARAASCSIRPRTACTPRRPSCSSSSGETRRSIDV